MQACRLRARRGRRNAKERLCGKKSVDVSASGAEADAGERDGHVSTTMDAVPHAMLLQSWLRRERSKRGCGKA